MVGFEVLEQGEQVNASFSLLAKRFFLKKSFN
jgi:hypothetical protein